MPGAGCRPPFRGARLAGVGPGRKTLNVPALHTEPQSAESHFLHDRSPWVDNGEPEPGARRSRLASAVGLVAIGGMTTAAAVVGARATVPAVDDWYAGLDKPGFTPPSSVFGPVWSGLYVLIALSGWRVWKAPRSRRRNVALALWGAQLLLNAAWSPLFFGLRRPRAALIDLAALGVTTAAFTLAARRVDRPAAMVMLPYLGWLGYAAAINEEIVRLND